MENSIASKLNWVDVIVWLFAIRIILIGYKKGFAIELFKLTGLILAVFTSFHYYTRVSDLLNTNSKNTSGFIDLISLVILLFSVIIVFKFIRDSVLLIIKIHPIEGLDKWGALILSLFRAAIVSSLIVVIMQLSTLAYVEKSAKESFSNKHFSSLAPRLYAKVFESVIFKFSPKEDLNFSIFKALEENPMMQKKQQQQ